MSALDELLPASFRGVSFRVEREKTLQKRSVVVHEYAGVDDWGTEDQGLRPYAASVTAYVARIEGVRPESTALWRACMDAGSPATLTLPHAGPRRMWCTAIERCFEKDKIGFIAFDLEFVATPPGRQGVSSLAGLASAASLAQSLPAALSAMIGAAR